MKDALNTIDPAGRWTMKKLEDIEKDKVLGFSILSQELQDEITRVYEETLDPENYANYDRAVVKQYGHYDIVYTMEAFLLTQPIVLARGQERTLKMEEELIMPLYRMEAWGFAFNKQYTLDAEKRVREYILERRQQFYKIMGEEARTNQHSLILNKLRELGLNIHSTGSEILDNVKTDDPYIKKFIKVIQDLRTLEKWYSTYIIKWLEDEVDGRVYTQINQAGTVSGRVTSNFQQFPKKPIKDDDGNEVFHPRRMIKVTGGDYNRMLYLDYSQIELRFQAIYTLLVSGGDTNLCRAYMPFRCVRDIGYGDMMEFDYKKDLKDFRKYDWYLAEDLTKKWESIDLHTRTTLTAYPHLSITDPRFQERRSEGKRANFAINYGAYINKLVSQLHYDKKTATLLYNSYYTAFPKVKEYRNYVQQMIDHQGYVENLFGRRYYGASGHHCANYLVQGSAADFMKLKIIAVDKLIMEKDFHSRFQMNIHDELSFELSKQDNDYIIELLRQEMENLPGTLVPIVADKELTYETWADKEDA
jgi:DNA polymerase-1